MLRRQLLAPKNITVIKIDQSGETTTTQLRPREWIPTTHNWFYVDGDSTHLNETGEILDLNLTILMPVESVMPFGAVQISNIGPISSYIKLKLTDNIKNIIIDGNIITENEIYVIKLPDLSDFTFPVMLTKIDS